MDLEGAKIDVQDSRIARQLPPPLAELKSANITCPADALKFRWRPMAVLEENTFVTLRKGRWTRSRGFWEAFLNL